MRKYGSENDEEDYYLDQDDNHQNNGHMPDYDYGDEQIE